jgi:hypothetical protein
MLQLKHENSAQICIDSRPHTFYSKDLLPSDSSQELRDAGRSFLDHCPDSLPRGRAPLSNCPKYWSQPLGSPPRPAVSERNNGKLDDFWFCLLYSGRLGDRTKLRTRTRGRGTVNMQKFFTNISLVFGVIPQHLVERACFGGKAMRRSVRKNTGKF